MKKSLLILLPLFLIFTIVACDRPTKAINQAASEWDEYKSPAISRALLLDTLPKKFFASLNVTEINGIKASYASGKFTSYFEYDADAETVLTSIGALPFKRSNSISDTTCRALNTPFSLSGKILLSNAEVSAAQFFWQINPVDFYYYECIKAPTRHTILIHKVTGRILHRVESVS